MKIIKIPSPRSPLGAMVQSQEGQVLSRSASEPSVLLRAQQSLQSHVRKLGCLGLAAKIPGRNPSFLIVSKWDFNGRSMEFNWI